MYKLVELKLKLINWNKYLSVNIVCSGLAAVLIHGEADSSDDLKSFENTVLKY